MKLNAILVFLILTTTFVILLTSLLNGRSILRPKAAAIPSVVTKNKVLIDPSRPLYFPSPSRPILADLTDAYPGNEVAYLTQNGDLYVYSSQLVYITSVSKTIDATPSAQTAALASVPRGVGLSDLQVTTGKKVTRYHFDATAQQEQSAVTTLTPTLLPEPSERVVYGQLLPTDQLPSAFFTRATQKVESGKTLYFNELVTISSVDTANPQDQLRVTTELLTNE